METAKKNILSQYNAAEFRFASNKKIFTYNIQKWHEDNKGKNIMFKGFIKDVLIKNGSTYIIFGCPIGSLVSKDSISFHLKTGTSDIESIIKNPPNALIYDALKYMSPNYYVVCNVDNILVHDVGSEIEKTASFQGKLIYAIDTKELSTGNNK